MFFKKSLLTAGALAAAFTFSPVYTPISGVPQAEAQLFCANDGSRFNEWKSAFKKTYKSKYKASTLAKLDGLKYDSGIIKSDRNNKKSFKGTFESFYARRTKGALGVTLKRWRNNERTLANIEKKYGVQAEVLMSIWVLETAFGRYLGNKNILQSIATLAYDCRRSKSLFFPEMLAAMTIIDRGMLDLSKRKGAWAGEIGQTQLLATRFLLGYADYDGGGVDVYKSAPDALATTANWFKKRGWRRGGGYLPGTSNYKLIQEWNRSDNYQKTIAVFADKLKKNK
ncbi:MAG: lytic murein transglycosylase [Rhizobiaceae bacterium]|nr:lytic murein transglycosylase [Rhizobiaceae bacterium]